MITVVPTVMIQAISITIYVGIYRAASSGKAGVWINA